MSRLEERLLALPLRGSLLLLKGVALLMGFLSFWILLKVVDLSNLNHPHEFAAATSHQKHTFSGIDSAGFHTGAGDGLCPLGDNRQSNLLLGQDRGYL